MSKNNNPPVKFGSVVSIDGVDFNNVVIGVDDESQEFEAVSLYNGEKGAFKQSDVRCVYEALMNCGKHVVYKTIWEREDYPPAEFLRNGNIVDDDGTLLMEDTPYSACSITCPDCGRNIGFPVPRIFKREDKPCTPNTNN